LTEWLSRIAVVAAKVGSRDDALRIWKAVVAVDPSEFRGLEELVKAGLRDELVQVYREFQKRIPASTVPARALKRIETVELK